MKILLMFCLLAAGTTIYAEECSQLDILKAQRNGASFDVTLRVVDDMGVPVEGARCEGWMWIDAHKDNGSSYETVTDSNGLARVTGKCGKWVSVAVSKEGYYSSQDEIRFSGLKKKGVLGLYEWQPYGSDVRVVLKRIINPTATGKRFIEQAIPAYGKWIGYDLEKAEWTPPYGNGKQSDVRIRFSAREVGMFDFGFKMELSFEEHPFAGVTRVKKNTKSTFQSVYNATTNSAYRGIVQFEVDRTGAAKRVWDQLEDDEYLVFRTRTKVNERGELVSAHYGRIDGEWKFYERHCMWVRGIYFNPIPNDTNLEDLETAERSRRDYLQQQEMRKNRK